jgi:hypothetical protein
LQHKVGGNYGHADAVAGRELLDRLVEARAG